MSFFQTDPNLSKHRIVMQRRALLSVMIAGAGLLGACGGGDTGSSTADSGGDSGGGGGGSDEPTPAAPSPAPAPGPAPSPAPAPAAQSWQVTTIAGGTTDGHADGQGGAATFNAAGAVVVDSQGNVFVGEGNGSVIRKITPGGQVSTFAGMWNQPGRVDGLGTSAKLQAPAGMTGDGADGLYTVGGSTVRRVQADGRVTTYAGAGPAGQVDGSLSTALFYGMSGIARAGNGDLYVLDSSLVRKISVSGLVTTIAGGKAEVGKVASGGFAEGAAETARFSFYPSSGIAIDQAGNIFIADTGNFRIRKIDTNGIVSTLAGGAKGGRDGSGSQAMFSLPQGLTIDGAGNLYVADNNSIRQVTPAGQVTTIAGSVNGPSHLVVDGPGAQARFFNASGITLDSRGRLIVGDRFAVRVLTPAGS